MANRDIYSLLLIASVALLLVITTTGIAEAKTKKPLEALALYTLATGKDQKIDNICKFLGISNNGEMVFKAKSHTILEDDERPMDIRGVIVLPLDANEPFEVIFAYRRSVWDQRLGDMINGYYLLTDETGKLKGVYYSKFWWVNGEMKQTNFRSIDNDIRAIFKQETEFWLKWHEGKNP